MEINRRGEETPLAARRPGGFSLAKSGRGGAPRLARIGTGGGVRTLRGMRQAQPGYIREYAVNSSL